MYTRCKVIVCWLFNYRSTNEVTEYNIGWESNSWPFNLKVSALLLCYAHCPFLFGFYLASNTRYEKGFQASSSKTLTRKKLSSLPRIEPRYAALKARTLPLRHNLRLQFSNDNSLFVSALSLDHFIPSLKWRVIESNYTWVNQRRINARKICND